MQWTEGCNTKNNDDNNDQVSMKFACIKKSFCNNGWFQVLCANDHRHAFLNFFSLYGINYISIRYNVHEIGKQIFHH